jgi:hypothetical protein
LQYQTLIIQLINNSAPLPAATGERLWAGNGPGTFGSASGDPKTVYIRSAEGTMSAWLAPATN